MILKYKPSNINNITTKLLFSYLIITPLQNISICLQYKTNSTIKYNKLSLLLTLHSLFSLFCCIIFSTLSENDYCLLNKLGQAK